MDEMLPDNDRTKKHRNDRRKKYACIYLVRYFLSGFNLVFGEYGIGLKDLFFFVFNVFDKYKWFHN